MNKLEDLDGSLFLTKAELEFCKNEAMVRDIKRRFEIGETPVDGITDPDELTSAKEDKYLNALTSRSMARYLGNEVYNEFKLDELFGVSYSSLSLPDFESDVSTD
jgi:hypothetical protein